MALAEPQRLVNRSLEGNATEPGQSPVKWAGAGICRAEGTKKPPEDLGPPGAHLIGSTLD